jgi:hypothetical protein
MIKKAAAAIFRKRSMGSVFRCREGMVSKVLGP